MTDMLMSHCTKDSILFAEPKYLTIAHDEAAAKSVAAHWIASTLQIEESIRKNSIFV